MGAAASLHVVCPGCESVVRVPRERLDELVAKELLAREIIIDFRPGAGIRISPHFYNSKDECRFVLAQIADVLDTSAYARHASVGGKTPT